MLDAGFRLGKLESLHPFGSSEHPCDPRSVTQRAWGLRTGSENKKGGAGLGQRTHLLSLSAYISMHSGLMEVSMTAQEPPRTSA